MSKYESHTDSTNMICPYCGASYPVESEEYAFGGCVEQCDECGKSFFLETFAEVTHRTSPNCDLNGDDHDWEEKATHSFCCVCGGVLLK